MTEKQIRDWKRERDIARAIADDESREKALQEVYDHKDDMIMECIAHQSDRVKLIMKDHDAMVHTHKMYLKEHAEMQGVKKALGWVKYILAIGGSGGAGAAIMKFFSN